MALSPKIPLSDTTFALFKRGVDASRKATQTLSKLWDTNLEKTFGDVPKDWDDGAVRVNREYALVKQKQALLYFRKPELQLKPMTPESEMAAPLAAAAVNQVLRRDMRVSFMMDEVLTDALCPAGIGVSKISYEAIMRPVQVKPPEHAETPDPVFEALVESQAAEWQQVQVPTYECYAWNRVPYKRFLYPTDFDGSSYDDAPWLGITFLMPKLEAKRTYKLTKDELERVAGDSGGQEPAEGRDGEHEDITSRVRGYEIWYRACYFDDKVAHKDHFRKLVYLEGLKKPVVHEDSPYQWYEQGVLKGVTRYPIRVLSLTYVPDRALPPSDVTITRPQVLELEKSRTIQMLQRERSLPLRWYDINQVPEEAESLLRDGVVQSWLPMNGPAERAIGEVSRATYPRENFEFDRVIGGEIGAAWALGPDQLGEETSGETTAREVSERASAAQTRLDYERAKVLRFFCEGAEVVFGLLQRFATAPKYAELVGQNGATQLVQWSKANLQGAYAFEARPDAALRLDAQSDRQQALNLYQLLRRDELVDARGLLTEVVRTHNMLPEKTLVQQPPEPKPDMPNISFRFSGEDLDPTRPHALMVYDLMEKTGVALDPQVIAQARALAAKMLTMASQNPLLALADTTRVDIRSDGAPPTQTPQPQHGGAVGPEQPLNKTQQAEGRVK